MQLRPLDATISFKSYKAHDEMREGFKCHLFMVSFMLAGDYPSTYPLN